MAHRESDFLLSRATLIGKESDRLRELVKRHRVCWEVWPEHHIDRKGERIQIGFELNLMGTHGHSEPIIEPGCPECIKIYGDLRRIAGWIIPKKEFNTWYEIGVFDASIYYSSQRRFRPEVVLTIKLLHREGFDRPTDSHEVHVLKEMEEKLKKLGARKGSSSS